ncbi:malate/lactate dehydrogenase [Microbacterium testaceum StLB037]|uniref:Malate/lactate dehydrogenase n=1 Tax=Microbacterium testaceum (strain StLB037) TaxID=979556 RepID=E8NCX5_MICTS|nr:malate/lactate dehydrogenase [Microbacterium testaceum StLB037]
MHRLEAHLEIEQLGLGDRDETLAPFLGSGKLEAVLAHLTGLAFDVAHGELEGAGSSGSHGRPCYPGAPG